MSTIYDFQTLSPEDFERLSRDLLSAKWKKPFEIFKSGRDMGIDLRYSKPIDGEKLIVQCKRYSPNGFARLKRVLSNSEISKVQKLNPSRYILITSVPLTVGQKDELFNILQPWCKSPSDIMGAEQVNALIGEYPEIQRAHFKLWLSSTAMLERILHSGIWNRTAATIDEIRTELCRFVTHDGLAYAAKILEEQKHCIIVGMPGIGKTTLAKILLYQYINIDYEAVVVSGDVEEAWEVVTEALSNNKKLVILYDDFLGQISFEHRKFAKTEEHRLLSLLKAIKTSRNIRFILTTREYILADAKRHHAALADAETFLEKFTLTLSHYSLANRARILFNHLFFSDLPLNRIEAIVESKIYQTIIKHKNYNPRIIRSISEHSRFKFYSDSEYIEKIGQEFNDPSQVWDHAFRNDIQPNSKILLYILWSFGDLATITALKHAFFKVIPNAFDGTQSDLFDRSIKELDGNFISSDRFSYLDNQNKFEICLKFQNPSIRDYLNSRIRSEPSLLLKLCNSCVRFSQIVQIFDHCDYLNGEGKMSLLNSIYALAIELFETKDESIINFAGERRLSYLRRGVIPEKLGFIIEVGDKLNQLTQNFDVIKSWIFSLEKWEKITGTSSFYSVARFVRLLLVTPSLSENQRKQFIKVFEKATIKCIDETYWLTDLHDIVSSLYEEPKIDLNIPKSSISIQVIEVVRQVQLTSKDNSLTVSDLEDELYYLQQCQSILGESYSPQITIMNQLIDEQSHRETEDEDNTRDNISTINHHTTEQEIEIDSLFSELLLS